MKYRTHNSLIIVVLLGIFLSCEKSTVWELEKGESSRLVVEAVLTNKFEIQKVVLSQSYSELTSEVPYITNAKVEVEAGGIFYEFIPHPEDPGLYISQDPFQVINNVAYNLNIVWKGEQYTSTTRLAPVTPLQSISFSRFGSTDSLILGSFVPLFSLNQQSFYEIDINWSFISAEEPNRAKIFYYTFKELDISQLVTPNRENVPFPVLSFVKVRKYGLSDEFAAFLRAKVIETDWNSIYFYSIPDKLPSNISNGGLGFFSACSVEERTVIARL
jgi:hypothetical protein